MSRNNKIKNLRMKKPYIQKTIIVNAKNIKQFKRPAWHREFRETHINKIMNAMMRDEHPSENITINSSHNKIGGYIINGNHRISAVRRLIDLDPAFSIELSFTVYYDLNRAQEIEVYEKVNNTRKETGLDKLKAHLTGTKIYRLIENRFPFRIVYRPIGKDERNVMPINCLLSAYLMKDRPSVSLGALAMIKQAVKLDEDDYDKILEFAEVFKDVCGEPSKDNLCSQYNVFGVFGKLYYTLVGVDLTKDEYKKRIQQLILRHTTDLALMSKGIHQELALYNFVFKKVKRGRKMFNVVTGQAE